MTDTFDGLDATVLLGQYGVEVVTVYIQLLNQDVKVPVYAKPLDAGMDVYLTEDVTFHPYETKICGLGFKVAIPAGYEIQVRPRSGMSAKTKFRLPNAPGTIDTGYRGEVGVVLYNDSTETFSLKKGDRIAQIVLNKVPMIKWEIVDDVDNIGFNRGGGWGSTEGFTPQNK